MTEKKSIKKKRRWRISNRFCPKCLEPLQVFDAEKARAVFGQRVKVKCSKCDWKPTSRVKKKRSKIPCSDRT